MDVKETQDRSQDLRERPHQANPSAREPAGTALMDCDHSADRDGSPAANTFGRKEWLFSVALVAAVFLVYMPCWHGGFVFDDDNHLLNNPVLQPGGLAKAWVPGSYLNYWPLTFSTYWVEFKLWGLTPLGFHLVNLALHSLAALLVWRVLARLQVPGALFAAAIFALLPVNVESVAWIAQLKGLLSLVLTLVSVLFYLSDERHASRLRFALAIVAFFLSALAKGAAMMLPVVLLACAWWQRGRIRRRDLLRVLPYFLIGAAMAGVELWGQHHVAQDIVVRSDDFLSRAAVAGCALWFYLGKLILPINLCPVYPRWNIDERNVLSYLPGLTWLVLLAWAWWQRRTWGRPAVILGMCYAALLLPTLGFANIYFMRYSLVADHWQYIATIVPCAVAAGVSTTIARRFLTRRAAIVAGVALLIGLAALSCRQSGVYENAETFYETTIKRNPECWLAENNLGYLLEERGQRDLAIAHYRRALDLNPNYPEANNNFGNTQLACGKFDSAIGYFERALRPSPNYSEAQNNLGNALLGTGRIDLAIAHYRNALQLKPGDAQVHYNLAVALAKGGQAGSAIAEYEMALELKPDYGEAHNNLATIFFNRGRVDSAIFHFQKALEEIKPENAGIHNNLALASAGSGQLDAAIAHYRRALEMNPNFAEARANLAAAISRRGGSGSANAGGEKPRHTTPDDAEAHCNLATNLARKGDVSAAITEYQKSLEINPDYALAHNNLGAVLISGGQVTSGIAHLRRAIEIQPDYAEAHFNLANGLASREEFDAAIAEYEKTLAIKPDYAAAQKNLAAVRSAQEKVLNAKPGQ